MTRRPLATVTITFAVLLGAGSGLAGCTAQSSPGSTGASASTTVAATTQVGLSLPDAIPLPAGAELVEGAKNFRGERAQGWTAVALTPAGTGLGATANELNRTLQTAGWTTKMTGSEMDGYVIACTRKAGAQSAWLNINVTIPVPGSGPAVTYRYAVGQDVVVSASP